mmetsp:Transcript_25827/g.63889  ORF Transcript_25827/g.63889 Transcript_25827/m.63889 type:complete len:405 (+) Transcript_25827:186-1400(+)
MTEMAHSAPARRSTCPRRRTYGLFFFPLLRACQHSCRSLGVGVRERQISGARRLGLPSIEEYRADDEEAPRTKYTIRLEVEEWYGDKARQQDGEGHCQVLQVVVRKADDDRDKQTPEGKHADHRPCGRAEAMQPSVGHHLVVIALVHSEELQRDREEAQLDVAHPDGGRVALEDLLQVDGGEARADAHADRRGDADEDVALVGGAGRLRALGQHDAEQKYAQRTPLVAAQRLAQDDHAEDGGGESLGLVEQLQQSGAEVRRRDELKVVLKSVADGRDGDLERIHLALPNIGIEPGERGERAPLYEDKHAEAEAELQDLREEHGHRGHVLPAGSADDTRVPEEQHVRRVLQDEEGERAVLELVAPLEQRLNPRARLLLQKPFLLAAHRRRLHRRRRQADLPPRRV